MSFRSGLGGMRDYCTSEFNRFRGSVQDYCNRSHCEQLLNATAAFSRACAGLFCQGGSLNRCLGTGDALHREVCAMRGRAYTMILDAVRDLEAPVADVVDGHPWIVGGVARVCCAFSAVPLLMNPLQALVFSVAQYASSVAISELFDRRERSGSTIRGVLERLGVLTSSAADVKDKIAIYAVCLLGSIVMAYAITQGLGLAITGVGAVGVALVSSAVWYSVSVFFSVAIVGSVVSCRALRGHAS